MVIANLCNTNKTPPRSRGGGFKNIVFEDGGVESLTLLREPPPLHFIRLARFKWESFLLAFVGVVTPSPCGYSPFKWESCFARSLRRGAVLF